MSVQSETNKPELLAPAGGWEQLEYALHFGADAVYLACDRFGLRARASNFSLEDLPRAVELAHSAGARVYVTCNAYAHDEDLAALPEYAQAMEAAGVDAAIVSDLGVMSVVQQHAPSVAIHVSTQASVSNAEAALMWYRLGARRVVCAREMSVAEIAAMRKAIPSDMEIEVFVHGAMCMAISGRCLISDYLTGRHANGTYLLNSKDLNMLAHLDDLAAAGVSSVKIEGRVKKAFYVATVVNAYRHVLDGEPASLWEHELEIISHRPYSTGFYYGDAEQTTDNDIYVQLCDWVGEVVSSAAAEQGQWRVKVKCRNRFYEGDELEVLSPHKPIRTIKVQGLAEVYDGAEVPSEVACKTMAPYAFTSSFELEPQDILRVRRKDPSKKN